LKEINRTLKLPVKGYQHFFFDLYWEIQEDLTCFPLEPELGFRIQEVPINQPVLHSCNMLADEAFSMPNLIYAAEI
jgi:hypothetical protein